MGMPLKLREGLSAVGNLVALVSLHGEAVPVDGAALLISLQGQRNMGWWK